MAGAMIAAELSGPAGLPLGVTAAPAVLLAVPLMRLTTPRPAALAATALALSLLSWPARAPLAQPTPASRLPALGDSVSDDMDLIQERRLGDRIMRDLRKDPDYLEDPLLQEYIESLFEPLLRSARGRDVMDAELDRKFAWQTFLVRDKAVNAFALPGGYIGVYLGLISMTATPDELASVLAHELTHVTQRHIARSMANSGRQTLATTAAMLLGVLAAARSRSTDALQAVVVGGQAIAAQGQLNFSRDMEREADRLGLELMGGAGFAASGMSAMFEKLDQSSRLNDGGQYPYLRSHPLTSERITEARLRAAGLPPPQGPGDVLHALMQARARVMADGGEVGLRRLQAQGAATGTPLAGTARLAALYAAALASTRLRDPVAADAALEAGQALLRGPALADAPGVVRAWRLLRIEALLGQLSVPAVDRTSLSARLQRAQAELGADGSRGAMLARAQVAMAQSQLAAVGAAGGLRACTESLQGWVAEHRRDAPSWDALSACAGASGQSLRALGASAEAAWARGDIVGAVDRYRAARQAARGAGPDQYAEAAIIESRLREVEAERRRVQAEAMGERDPG